jgi:hypothetical protein
MAWKNAPDRPGNTNLYLMLEFAGMTDTAGADELHRLLGRLNELIGCRAFGFPPRGNWDAMAVPFYAASGELVGQVVPLRFSCSPEEMAAIRGDHTDPPRSAEDSVPLSEVPA